MANKTKLTWSHGRTTAEEGQQLNKLMSPMAKALLFENRKMRYRELSRQRYERDKHDQFPLEL